MTRASSTCTTCGAQFHGDQAHCTMPGCHETFTGPASYDAHWVGKRCVRPHNMPGLTQRPDGVWKLTTIPGQLALSFPGRRR